MDVTLLGMTISPRQPVLPVTTLLTIVKDPPAEQSTVPFVPSYAAAFAGVVTRPDMAREIVAIRIEVRRMWNLS